nr:DUF6339 family protein [Limosilactobacillus equigenerosi]
MRKKEELINLFNENSFVSSIEAELPKLDFSEDVGESDTINAQRLYEALKHLTPHEAADERLWIYLFHVNYYDFLRYRVPKTRANDLETGKFNNSAVLFTGNNERKGRGKTINYLSRLWWAGYFACIDGNYDLLPLITKSDFSSNMILLFGGSRQFANNLTLSHGYLKAMKKFFLIIMIIQIVIVIITKKGCNIYLYAVRPKCWICLTNQKLKQWCMSI